VNQELSRQMLRRLGFEIDIAENGLQALRRMEERPYEVVLMDCQMPEMDGFALLDEIRRWQQGEASRGCRLIAVSAHPAEDMRTDCWARGFDEYVEKPVSRKSLVAALSGFGRSGS
jgi:CheY-like chemotaxis protein